MRTGLLRTMRTGTMVYAFKTIVPVTRSPHGLIPVPEKNHCTWHPGLSKKINGAMATIIALNRALRNKSVSTGSVYDEKGILVL